MEPVKRTPVWRQFVHLSPLFRLDGFFTFSQLQRRFAHEISNQPTLVPPGPVAVADPPANESLNLQRKPKAYRKRFPRWFAICSMITVLVAVLLSQGSQEAGAWSAPKHNGAGWAAATSQTITSSGNGPSSTSLNELSPELGAYLANLGSHVGVSVYDLTRHSYYTYNANTQFMMASSAKVPIMLTFLDMVERQGREPTANEMSLLTTMIENSNNDSASALYYGEIGGAQGVANYMQKIGISGITLNSAAWGYSTITPQVMVNLLTLLYSGNILTPPHRNLALSLMEQVEPDQRAGVGDTAPSGATVALKNGWVTDSNNLWVVNSSGIVMLGSETYIIAIYTQGLTSLDNGHAITRHVAGTVASRLS